MRYLTKVLSQEGCQTLVVFSFFFETKDSRFAINAARHDTKERSIAGFMLSSRLYFILWPCVLPNTAVYVVDLRTSGSMNRLCNLAYTPLPSFISFVYQYIDI